MGGALDPKNGIYMGGWGDFGCPTPQRIATYSLSANRQRPFAGAANAAVFNVFRRFRHQVLYVVPPFVAAYAAMNWAIERNEYLNSKPGRLEAGSE
ncbi:Cytochrome b-c1 complex subunit 8 [Penicillium riverlandense]|uniref:Cytochrome b-c1 complex subunit 8 n=1 Tax=Penicillium riverlandense TaxID=1903569 RepID=UPI00254701A5|nr:Cytochrome b-c1 complex subunit 8 [Penicillium riverlandense]KAJ5832088.1 Cytochrome b-c1 complex subunit 8 [Penicillium riverlandense]